jgi:hypothetical protein
VYNGENNKENSKNKMGKQDKKKPYLFWLRALLPHKDITSIDGQKGLFSTM